MNNKEAIEYITRLSAKYGTKMAIEKEEDERKLSRKFYQALELALEALKRNAREEELFED